MPATLSRSLQAEVIQSCLSERERNVLLMYSRGGAQNVLSLYRNDYGDAATVEEAVERLQEKVERAAAARVRSIESHDQEETLADKLRTMAGVPGGALDDEEESEADENIEGTGAELDRSRDLPPSGSAPGSLAGRHERSSPRTPHTPFRHAVTGTALHEHTTPNGLTFRVHHRTHPRWRQIVDTLSQGRCTKRRLVDIIGEGEGAIDNTLYALRRQGIIEHTTENAKDWKGAQHTRRPSRVVKLVDEPEGTPRAANSSEPGDVYKRAAPDAPAQCEHGRPHTRCEICQTPQFPARFAEADEELDVRALWESMDARKRHDMAQIVMADLISKAHTV